MKCKSLLLGVSAILCSMGQVSAQDFTPANWKFSEMKTGSASSLFVKETCKSAWNIGFPYRAADNMNGAMTLSIAPGGDIVTAGKLYADMADAEKAVFDDFIQSASIVPGGDLGNLFCIKGKDLTEEDARGVKHAYNAPNTTLWFFSGTDLPLASNYRVSFSFRTILNPEVIGAALSFTMATSHYDGVDDGSYRQKEVECYPEFNEYWTTAAFDIAIEDNTDAKYAELPLVVKLFLKGGIADKGMLLLKDVTITKINQIDNTYVPAKIIEEDFVDTSISSTRGNNNVLIWSEGNEITVLDAKEKIEVYSFNGTLIAEKTPDFEVTTFKLDQRGVYLVKVGDTCKKIVF